MRLAFDADYEAVLMAAARRDRLDAAIEAMAADSEFTPVVRRLCCLRGISTLTGFALAVEIGDWDRFTGSTIGAYLGLVPSESLLRAVPGRRAPITKTGNTHARRLLVEAAWHHRKPLPRPGDDHAGPVGAGPAGRAGPRPCRATAACTQRWIRFIDRRKRPVVANVAVARELAGWCWSLAVMDE